MSTTASTDDAARAVHPTAAELKTSKYTSSNLQVSLEALHQDGFVVLKSVVDIAHVDHLNEFLSKEADDLVKNNSKPFNQGVNCRLLHFSPLS